MTARRRAILGLALVLFGAGAERLAAQEADTQGRAATRIAALPACDRARFAVALDVGHSPEQPGAMSARGTPEFVFNLLLAERVERALRAAGFDRTRLLITWGRAKPSLFARVSQANDGAADLYLSVHHDAVPQQFKEAWEHEGRTLEYSDRFKGHSLFVSTDHADYKGSLAFARRLGLQMKARGLAYTPHYTEPFMGRRRRQLVDAEAGVYRFDELVVLRRTAMPAVLLEGGMIVHRDEELELAGAARHELIAASVVAAVEQVCAARPAEMSATRRQKPAPKPPLRAGPSQKAGISILPGRD